MYKYHWDQMHVILSKLFSRMYPLLSLHKQANCFFPSRFKTPLTFVLKHLKLTINMGKQYAQISRATAFIGTYKFTSHPARAIKAILRTTKNHIQSPFIVINGGRPSFRMRHLLSRDGEERGEGNFRERERKKESKRRTERESRRGGG